MIGIQIDDLNGTIPNSVMETFVGSIISKLMNEYRIIIAYAKNKPSVLVFQPPLIVNEGQIDYFVNCLDKILEDWDSILKLAAGSVKNIGSNIIK